ncbi:MAG: helix-turn-helix domain-containing protein, partial [Candidatus Bathyarchaeota archaeon]
TAMTSVILEKELRRFDLSPSEVKIYDFLLRNDKPTISKMSQKLKIAPTNMYPIVKSLMSKGFIESTFTKPVRLHAVPLSKALDLLIMQRKILLSRDVDSLEKIKENIIAKYQKVAVAEKEAEVDRFQILKDGSIYSKLLMSLDKVSNNLYCSMSKKSFVKLYKTDFLDKLAKLVKKKAIQAVFLLDESLRSIDVERVSTEVKFVKEADIDDFLVFDDKELFYYLDKPATNEEDLALWTTLPSLVMIFKNMFETSATRLEEEPHKIKGYHDYLLAKKVAKKLFSTLFEGYEEGGVITGASGFKYEFDMLLKLNSKITAVDFFYSKQPINVMQVLPFYVKTFDLKESVTNFVLLVNSEIDKESEEFLKNHGIDVEVLQA